MKALRVLGLITGLLVLLATAYFVWGVLHTTPDKLVSDLSSINTLEITTTFNAKLPIDQAFSQSAVIRSYESCIQNKAKLSNAYEITNWIYINCLKLNNIKKLADD